MFYTVMITLIKLSLNSKGRVEIYHNGKWGTVCDHEWDNADARVVCRQLGFGSSGIAYRSAYYGQGTGPIWLNNVSCIGDEYNLANCEYVDKKIGGCAHSNDAGVDCRGRSYRR